MKNLTFQRFFRKTMPVLGLTVAGLLFADHCAAQEAVEDIAAITNAMREYALQAMRWTETHQHYLDQAKQYSEQEQHYVAQEQFWQQQLIKLNSLSFELRQAEVAFKERPLDYGVTQACPNSALGPGHIVEGMFQPLLPKLSDDVPKQQQQICGQIVVAKNSKYNATVAVLERLVKYQDYFLAIETQRNAASKNPGDLAANDNEALRFVGALDSEMRYWQANMSAYDQYIDDLKDQQSMLATHAMKGSQSSAWSQVVDTIALKAALSL